MKLAFYSFEAKKEPWSFMLEPHGDHQIGSKLFDEAKLDDRISVLAKDDNRFTILMGDMCDNINAYAGGAFDKRYDPTQVVEGLNTFERQADFLVSKYAKVKHKILGAMCGNHEWKTTDEDRFIKNIVEPLRTKYLGAMCFIHLEFTYKRKYLWSVEVWATHGGYAGQQVGGAINRLRQLAGVYDADIYLHAHTHDKMVYPDVYYYHDWKTAELKERTKMFGITGTFQHSHLKDMPSYVERQPKPRAAKVGTITIGIDPWSKKIHGYE